MLDNFGHSFFEKITVRLDTMDVGCPPPEMAGMSKSGVVFHATFSKWGDTKLDAQMVLVILKDFPWILHEVWRKGVFF